MRLLVRNWRLKYSSKIIRENTYSILNEVITKPEEIKNMMTSNTKINAWLDRPVFSFWPRFTIYHLIIALILITAVLSRFIMLGDRTMSHDETNHVSPPMISIRVMDTFMTR